MTETTDPYDVVILGSGPAGLQAAVHAARAKTRVAVLGRLKQSSLHKAHVENYCCMSHVATGEEMLAQGKIQAEKFGASFLDEDVVAVDAETHGRFRVILESGQILSAWSLILAMGISRNRLKVPGEKELQGKGVSSCVDCDGHFYRNEPVAVVGNGSAAASGAMTLLMIASRVHLIYRGLEVDDRLREQVERSDIIRHPEQWVAEIQGTEALEGVTLDNGETLEVSALFVELGAKGALELAAGLGVTLDPEEMRFILTNKKQETNIPGIYAAGDICGPPWQMAKSIGEGCVAGLEAAAYAKEQRKK